MRKPDAGKVLDLGSAGGDGSSGDGNREIDLKGSDGTSTSLSLIHGLGIRSDVIVSLSAPGSLALCAYGERLLSTFPAEGSTGVRIKEPAESVSEMVSSPSSSSLPSGSGSSVDPLRAFEKERERESDDDDEVTGCREAVEILTRNPKKGMFYFID